MPNEKPLSVAFFKAKEVIVTLNTNDWPDYVFKEGYNLMSLEELEKLKRKMN